MLQPFCVVEELLAFPNGFFLLLLFFIIFRLSSWHLVCSLEVRCQPHIVVVVRCILVLFTLLVWVVSILISEEHHAFLFTIWVACVQDHRANCFETEVAGHKLRKLFEQATMVALSTYLRGELESIDYSLFPFVDLFASSRLLNLHCQVIT